MWLEDARCSDGIDLAWRRNFLGNPIAQVEGKIKVSSKTKAVEPGFFWEYYSYLERKKATT